MSGDHCANPDTCPTNVERERDMRQIKRDYDNTQKQLKDTDGKLNVAITEAAITNTKVDELVKEIRRDRADNQRLHEMHITEFKAVHKRVTDGRVETVKMIGDAKLVSAHADGQLTAAQVETKGMIKGKVDWAEIIKLVLLLSAILGIFKYLLPAG